MTETVVTRKSVRKRAQAASAGAPPTIHIDIGTRREPPRPDEPPITCAACAKLRQAGGVARVMIAAALGIREDMPLLCSDCVHAPKMATDRLVQKYWPGVKVVEGGKISTQ